MYFLERDDTFYFCILCILKENLIIHFRVIKNVLLHFIYKSKDLLYIIIIKIYVLCKQNN